MDMTKDAINTIKELAVEAAGKKIIESERVGNAIFAVDGDGEIQRLEVMDPVRESIKTHTLNSIIDYVQTCGDLDRDHLTIHVESEKTVYVYGNLNSGGYREKLMVAHPFLTDFEFGRFYDVEDFNIALQAGFTKTDDRETILQVVGNLKDENVKNYSDDGISQQVTIKQGVASLAKAIVPNPVNLAPYRTFIEIDQPASNFVFRMKDGGRAALFESDGGAWRNEAIKNITDYLSKGLAEAIESSYVRILA